MAGIKNPTIAKVNYNASIKNPPLKGNISLSTNTVDGKTMITANLDSVDKFAINLSVQKKAWNEDIQSKIMQPLAQLLVNEFTDKIKDQMEKMTIPSIEIPAIPISAKGFSATVKVKSLDLSTLSGMLLASGEVEVSL